MTRPVINNLPPFPVRGEDPVTFAQKANDTVAAYPAFVTETNAVAAFVENEADAASLAKVDAEAAQVAAELAATNAESSALSAASIAGASLWVSGQTYSIGDAAISLIDLLTYRAVTTTSGTTDPSLSADWVLISGNVSTNLTQTLSNKTIEKAILNNGYTEEVFAITDGASVNLDPNNGSIQTWTLGASRTPDQANWAAGQSITLLIDDGTDYAITWSTLAVVWKTDGGVAPTLNTTGFTVIVLWKVGTTIYGARVGDA